MHPKRSIRRPRNSSVQDPQRRVEKMKPCYLFSTNALKCICFVVGLCSVASTLQADDDFEHPPISYQDSPSRDLVARLLVRIQSGDESLVSDSNGNYLKSLLHALNVPETSQCLVFSKTSMQILHISPRTPRAIYFNDSTYVGMVVGSPILELAWLGKANHRKACG